MFLGQISISSPNRMQFLLDDNVRGSVGDTQTLSSDHTAGADADN